MLRPKVEGFRFKSKLSDIRVSRNRSFVMNKLRTVEDKEVQAECRDFPEFVRVIDRFQNYYSDHSHLSYHTRFEYLLNFPAVEVS